MTEIEFQPPNEEVDLALTVVTRHLTKQGLKQQQIADTLFGFFCNLYVSINSYDDLQEYLDIYANQVLPNLTEEPSTLN